MIKETSLEIVAIKGIVQAINECWRLKDYEGIGAYLAEDVVMAPHNPKSVFVDTPRTYSRIANMINRQKLWSIYLAIRVLTWLGTLRLRIVLSRLYTNSRA